MRLSIRSASLAVAGVLLAGSMAAQTAPISAAAPSAPTRDQRALKVLAEARDLVSAGRPDESIPFYGHALDLAEAELDEPSVALANLLAEYGNVLRAAGFRERARVSLERSLAMLEALKGHDDPQLAPALLAVPLVGLGRLDADEEHFDEAETGLQRSLDLIDEATQPELAVSARVALGRCAESGGHPEAAFDHYRDAVVAARAASIETPEVATALHHGAHLLLRRGDAENAILFFRQALQLRGRLLGETNWRTAETAMELARALDGEGQRPEAREIANEATRSLGRTCAPSSQASSEVRDLCTELSLLRRSLVAEARPTKPVPDTSRPAPTPPPPSQAPPSRPPPAPMETAPPAWRVQVSSQQSPSEAERLAEIVRRTYPALLRAQPLLIYRVEVAGGIWHRVLFGAFDDRAGAVALCDALKREGLADCLPARSE